MSMLLTLYAGSLKHMMSSDSDSPLDPMDLPRFAIRELELLGLTLPASMLSGWSLDQMDTLRDRADKAGCPCLILIEDQPLSLGSPRAKDRASACDRTERLAVAAHRLGCNAVAVQCDTEDSDENLERIAEEIKSIMPRVERLELNLLLLPGKGLTATPERLTDLIKAIGGFRIGSLPTFAHAASCGDPVDALRKLAPYAGAVQATIAGFGKNGEHKGYDLTDCIHAIRSVGFVNTVAIDFVGRGDPVENITRAREILQTAIESESEPLESQGK